MASGLSIRKAGLSEPRPQPWSYHRESPRPQIASSKIPQGLWDSPMIKSEPHFSLEEGRAVINLESNKYQGLQTISQHFPADWLLVARVVCPEACGLDLGLQ